MRSLLHVFGIHHWVHGLPFATDQHRYYRQCIRCWRAQSKGKWIGARNWRDI